MISCKNCGGLNIEGSLVCGACGVSLINTENVVQNSNNNVNNFGNSNNINNSVNSVVQNNQYQYFNKPKLKWWIPVALLVVWFVFSNIVASVYGSEYSLEGSNAFVALILTIITTVSFIGGLVSIPVVIFLYVSSKNKYNNLAQSNNSEIQINNNSNYNDSEKKENIIFGVLGAFIGSLGGVIVILMFSRLGYIAGIAGMAMGFFTLVMYKKLAGSISKKGVMVSVIIMFIMTLVAENLAISIDITQALKGQGMNPSLIKVFFNFYKILDKLIDANIISVLSYCFELLMLYLFTFIGSFEVIKQAYRTAK